MFGLFKRREAPSRTIPPQPPAEKDWEVGDKAECIAGGPWIDGETRLPCDGPRRGQVFQVSEVLADLGTVCLGFLGFDRRCPAGCFRKLRPCTADFREQLRRQVKVPKRKPELVE